MERKNGRLDQKWPHMMDEREHHLAQDCSIHIPTENREQKTGPIYLVIFLLPHSPPLPLQRTNASFLGWHPFANMCTTTCSIETYPSHPLNGTKLQAQGNLDSQIHYGC